MGNKRNDGYNLNLQIPIQPNIGLDRDARQAIVEILNITLADEVMLTIKTRGAHWKVSGAGFIELQILFASQYDQLNAISNEIAERVLMLGGVVTGSLQEFIRYTRVEERSGVAPGILHLLADHEAAVRFLREDARKCTEDYEDEGTFELMVRIMRLHENMAWKLRSFIEPELQHSEKQNASSHAPVEQFILKAANYGEGK